MIAVKRILQHTINTLGPGLLFSGAAIGVSHLVMSTKAGARFGLSVLVFVILANFFKYPFFQFGPRYAVATGRDLLDGYQQVGKNALHLYVAFTVITMFIFIAAVTIVTAGLAIVLLDLTITVWQTSFILLIITALILSFGHYHYLVRIIKVIIIGLTVSTIIAFFMSLYAKLNLGFNISPSFITPSLFSDSSISFLIALMGWMPAPIELSVWHSIWQLEKKKDDPSAGSLEGALIDFNVGYYGTAIIALLFVCLGAFLMYGTGQEFPSDAIGFSRSIINLYTKSLGNWAWWVIAIAAFTTMFSTTITLLDAYSRVMAKSLHLISNESWSFNIKNNDFNYNIWLLVNVMGALFVLGIYLENMASLTSFATILSFITAPIFAGLNYKVINDSHIPREFRISYANKILSYFGLGFLTIVTVLYLVLIVIF